MKHFMYTDNVVLDFDYLDKLPSLDFVAGLIIGAGCFTWVRQNGHDQPVFQLKMHASERHLVEQIRLALKLNESIHEYNHSGRHYVILIVRSRSSIEEKIIPAFESRLFGKKAAIFYLWKEKYFQHVYGHP